MTASIGSEIALARAPRLVLADQAHHVIQRGANRQAIFFGDADRRFFLDRLGVALAKEGCALHAYVLMTNHIHLLVTPRSDDGVGRLMQSLGRSYVGHVNRAQGRTGSLWEGRFKSTILDTDRYLMACHHYIEANPLRTAMVAHPREHRWSSWGHNGDGRLDPLIIEHELYRALGDTAADRRQAYRRQFAEGLPAELVETLRDAAQRGWVPGRDKFREQIERALGRRASPPVRGRPPKARLVAAPESGDLQFV